jgi:hypothetical protein
MSDQTTMNGQSKKQSSAKGRIGAHVADLMHDLMSLGELQMQLLGVDLRDARSRSAIPGLLIALALMIAIASMPVLLIGIGYLLMQSTEVSEGVALVSVALLAFASASLIGLLAWRKFKQALALLTRSQNEFRENIHWIKHALKRRSKESDQSNSEIGDE